MTTQTPSITSAAKYVAWGWSSLGTGLVLLLVVTPIAFFSTLGEAVSNGFAGEPSAINWSSVVMFGALACGLAGIVTGIVLLVVASARNAQNREAAQAAALEAQMRARVEDEVQARLRRQASDSV